MNNIEHFFQVILGDDPVRFVLIRSNDSPEREEGEYKNKYEYLKHYSNFRDIEDKLRQYEDNHFKCYFKVNSGGFKDVKINKINSFFIDIDFHEETNQENLETKKQETIEMLQGSPLPPTIIVSSRRGVHAYWVLKTSILRKAGESTNCFKIRFKEVQLRLIKYFNSCSGVKALSNNMRIPTFNGSEIIEINEDLKYSKEQLLECYWTELTKEELNTKDIDKSHYKAIYYNKRDFWTAAKKEDFRSYLGVNVGLNENFNCVFHKDQEPSAVISRGSDGIYRYFCNSDKCEANNSENGITIIDIFELNGYRTWKQKFNMIKKTFNIDLISNEWIEGEKEKYENNLEFLHLELNKTDMPHTYQLVKHFIVELELIINEAKRNIRPILHDGDDNSVFFISNTCLAQRLQEKYSLTGNLYKLNRYLNLICYLGFINKVKMSPKSSLDIVKESYRISKDMGYRVINYYSINDFISQKRDIEKRAKKLRESGFTIRAMSKQYIESLDAGNTVYQQQEQESKKQKNIREKVKKKIIELINTKKYAYKKDIKIKYSGKHVKQDTIYTQYKKALVELQNEGDYVEKKLNKDLKNKLGINVKGYPKVIMNLKDIEEVENSKVGIKSTK